MNLTELNNFINLPSLGKYGMRGINKKKVGR